MICKKYRLFELNVGKKSARSSLSNETFTLDLFTSTNIEFPNINKNKFVNYSAIDKNISILSTP